MAFLTACGVTIPVVVDSFDEMPEFVGDLHQRSSSGALGETDVARKRHWTGTVQMLQAGPAEVLRKLLEADGHAFSFASNTFSNKGVGPDVGGSFTQTGSGGPFSGRITAASGNFWPVSLQTAMRVPGGWAPATQGFTVLVWRFETTADDGNGGAGTWVHYICTGNATMTGIANPAGVSQFRNGIGGTFNAGAWLTVSGTGAVRLNGKGAATGTSVAKDYADLVVLPYAIDTATVAGLFSFHSSNPWPGPGRRVRLAGDAIPDVAGVDVMVKVTKLPQMNVRLGGAHRNNARRLELDILEV